MNKINIDDLTSNVTTKIVDDLQIVIGDGVFDRLMETVGKHLEAQFNNGRIKGEQYSALYAQLMQVVLQVAYQYALQKPVSDSTKESEEAKKELYKRQTRGYDDDAKIKVLRELITGYSMAFSVAKDDPNLVIPESIRSENIDCVTTALLEYSKLGSMENGSIGFTDKPYDLVTKREK